MRLTHSLALAIFFAAGVIIATRGQAVAAADPDALPPGYPAWCQGHRGSTETAYMELKPDLEGLPGQGYSGWFSTTTIRALARTACSWRNDGENTKIQTIYHQRRSELMNLAGLSDAEVDELLAAYLDQMKIVTVEREFCSKGPDEGAGPREVADQMSAQVLACPEVQSRAGEYDWPDASEMQKLAQDGECMEWLARNFEGGQHTMAHGLRFAMCNAGVAHLDGAKFLTEVAKLPSIPRSWAKIRHGLLMRNIAEARADYGKIAGKDPTWKAFLFDEPAKALAAFTADYAAHKAAYDELHDMILAHGPRHGGGMAPHGKKASGKCQTDYLGELTKVFAARHPGSVEAAVALMREPHNAMLAWGTALCGERSGDLALRQAFSPPRGAGLSPKRIVFWAAIAYANSQDDDDMHLSGKELGPMGPDSSDGVDLNGGGPDDNGRGVIDKVARTADGKVRVTFKSVKWESPTFNCVETNKVDSIGSDGKINYRRNCTPSGVEKVTSTATPIEVDARFAAALKPGRRLVYDETTGMPYAVYASKDAKSALVGYLGFAW